MSVFTPQMKDFTQQCETVFAPIIKNCFAREHAKAPFCLSYHLSTFSNYPWKYLCVDCLYYCASEVMHMCNKKFSEETQKLSYLLQHLFIAKVRKTVQVPPSYFIAVDLMCIAGTENVLQSIYEKWLKSV